MLGRACSFLDRVRRSVTILLGRSRFIPPQDPAVVFDLTEDIEPLPIMELMILMSFSGLPVYLLGRLRRQLLAIGISLHLYPSVRIAWGRAEKWKRGRWSILFSDTDFPPETEGVPSPERKRVRLWYDYAPPFNLPPGHFAMPVPMHRAGYLQYAFHAVATELRAKPRKIRMLFAGNWDVGYENDIIGPVCGKPSRYELIKLILDRGLARVVRSEKELLDLASGPYRQEFVFLDKSVRIEMPLWLDCLALADFFFCPPGVYFPWAHNCSEAMAAGTIPLLNYPEWLYPALEPGKNCMTFNAAADLPAAIDRVLALEASEIAAMRGRMTAHYHEHLDPVRFIGKLLKHESKEVHLHIWEESPSYIKKAVRKAKASATPLPPK